MELRWQDGLPPSSLFRLLRRQEHLQSINVEGAQTQNLMLCLLPPITSSHLRHLQKLDLYGIRIPFSFVFTFAGLLAEDALPLLEELGLMTCEKGGVVAVMQALRGGACRLLHRIFKWSPIPLCSMMTMENGRDVSRMQNRLN
jgi:hypothetical protein